MTRAHLSPWAITRNWMQEQEAPARGALVLRREACTDSDGTPTTEPRLAFDAFNKAELAFLKDLDDALAAMLQGELAWTVEKRFAGWRIDPAVVEDSLQ